MSTDTVTRDFQTKINGDRIVSQQFAQMLTAYCECSDAIQAVVRDMAKVYTASDATDDEREAALSTITEALFAKSNDGSLGLGLDAWESDIQLHSKAILEEMDREEATFGERVTAILEVRGMTQADLATAIGVQQPAISMMVSRTARPQRRTVEKIAEALNVAPEEIWPGTKGD